MRKKSIDILRGFAVLGILLMNIISFAMPDSAYFNPRAYAGDVASNEYCLQPDARVCGPEVHGDLFHFVRRKCHAAD